MRNSANKKQATIPSMMAAQPPPAPIFSAFIRQQQLARPPCQSPAGYLQPPRMPVTHFQPPQSPYNSIMSPTMMLANLRTDSRGDSAMSLTTPQDEPRASTSSSLAENVKAPSATPQDDRKIGQQEKANEENGEEDDDCNTDPYDDSNTSGTLEIPDSDGDYNPELDDDLPSSSASKRPLDSCGGGSSASDLFGPAKKKKVSHDDVFGGLPLFFNFGRRRRFGGGRRKKEETKKKPPRADGGKVSLKKGWYELAKASQKQRFKDYFQKTTSDLFKKFTSSDYNERLPEHPVAKVTLKVDFENGTSQEFVADKKKIAASTPAAGGKAAASKELFSFF